jgi:iron complex transport system ATP-binding protein
MISVRNVSYSYGRGPVVDSVSTEIAAGEMVALVGANGSGKSTLMKLLARVLQPRSGELLFQGREVGSWDPRAYAREVGYLAQDHEPAFPMQAREVVLSGRAPYLSRFGWETASDYDAAERALARCDAAHLADRYLEEMSGGEKQRVFLARVLAGDPKLILLDEPFVALDIAHTQSVSELLRSIAAERSITVVFVSHDLNWSAAYAGRMLVMKGGRLVMDGTPAQVMRSEVMREHFAFDGEAVPAAGRDHAWIVPSVRRP